MIQTLVRRLGLAASLLILFSPDPGLVQAVRRFGLETPLRDGIHLLSDPWLPAGGTPAPFFNPSQNAGNPAATDTVWAVAVQQVHHDRARPSRIILPVPARSAPGPR